MIRIEAGMSTARFCALIDMPERTWRRWQARARDGRPPRGPWPAPVREAVEPYLIKHAEAHTAWGHRKVWAMTRHDGHQLSPSTALRILRRRGLLQPAGYTRERRQLAAARRAAFTAPPHGPNQVWQLDFSEFETTRGGTWRIAGCADYWSKYEFGWHIGVTANQHDAVAAVELAITEAETLAGEPLLHAITDKTTGEVRQIVLVTDNGGPFKSDRFARFIASRPELTHVRTKVKSPGQNGVRERAFGTLKYERLYREEITDGSWLAEHANAFRLEFNSVRPHEALSWNRPREVHLALADPATPNFPQPETLPPA
ncbi:MAG TPA: integrase core domain-containing protein [Actinomycetota bacterium]|nr:integrase core domain-containing protein [Actinomycetota bacterium]